MGMPVEQAYLTHSFRRCPLVLSCGPSSSLQFLLALFHSVLSLSSLPLSGLRRLSAQTRSGNFKMVR